jgi:hypothetical protein
VLIILSGESVRQAGLAAVPSKPGVFISTCMKPVPHYFFRKKYAFFSEEIMMHASCALQKQCLIISSEKNTHFFLKK